MGTVVITGVSPNPEIYGTLSGAVAYLTALYGDAYTAWVALSTDDKGRTLVAATRYLDRLGLVDENDVAIGHDTAIEAVQFATYELAALITDDPELVQQVDASANIQSVTAGSAGVTYFNPTTVRSGTATKLPYAVQQLIADYLPSASEGEAGDAYGQAGDCSSGFSDENDYDRGDPF